MINPIEIRCIFDISEGNMLYIKIEYLEDKDLLNSILLGII
ncbi:MAG: hypothetical protein RSE91_03725 [Bacilli bacterium]